MRWCMGAVSKQDGTNTRQEPEQTRFLYLLLISMFTLDVINLVS